MAKVFGAALAIVMLGCAGAAPPLALPAGACSPAEGDARPWEERGHRLAVPLAFAPRRGAERPRVVIQAFSDFECPYCARAVPTIERVLEDYGACVMVVWRNRPMRYHANAERAARAAVEVQRQAGDEAFWRYHDLLFANQSQLGREDLLRYAEGIEGVDASALAAAIDEGAHQAVIERDLAALDAIERRLGTPTFVVNGDIIHGARPYETFRDAVEDALREQLQ